MPILSPFDPIGPLQLRIMNHLWAVNVATVQQVMDGINGQPGAPTMAYTTFLTVMRNLAKRRIIDQRRIPGTKRHHFVVLVDADSFKSGLIRQICRDYCNNDPAVFRRYLAGSPDQA